MSSPVHHELGERRMRYGPKGTRAYARKPYRDAWGDVVPALFPDEEEVEFAEPPNAPIQETTVGRRILMPHFQRAAETINGNVDGKEGNAPETHGIRNGTHGDVGKVDMCVLNPAPWNPGWNWGGTGVSKFII
ncbi:hypothetical protein YC2023_072909 [Brassica napus]